ncbi:GTP-binding protein Di-Ras3 [Ochotona princeps]|uniref:GTP-binding protein Di-Ras3 n=1 Tax=Ochotona princeps TaxID=9978 RepID=UPI00032B008E|nr:GTP-binding protein Di-Ras3 [Ochotona princeps]
MGNSCFPLKERLLLRLRALPPSLRFIRAFTRYRRRIDYRIVVVGSSGVGKSAIVKRWVRSTFRDKYLATLESTHRQGLGRNKIGALHITDTTGTRQYPGLKHFAILRGHAFVLVYSVAKKETLDELKPFYDLIRRIKGSSLHKFPVVLVGNQSDQSYRELSASDGAARAQEWNCAFLETSAKTEFNVQELFHMLLNHEKMSAACLPNPQKNFQVSKAVEKLLTKCIVM